MGETGAAWLQQLDVTVSRVAADWDLRVGRVLDGGTSALVAEVVMPGEIAAILKLALPDPGLNTIEADILTAAHGRGYARLYHYNRAERAMVLERLGPAMWQEHWPQDQQLRFYCSAVEEAWKVRLRSEGPQRRRRKSSLARRVHPANVGVPRTPVR